MHLVGDKQRSEAETIQQYLHDEIPLTRAMGLTVAAVDPLGVTLAAPLDKNINHRDTAFGGSIATMGILAGWALVHRKLIELGSDARLVIQDSHTSYIRPIAGDIRAECRCEKPETWENFATTLARKGRARLALRSEMYAGDEIAAVHDGLYVAVVPPAAS